MSASTRPAPTQPGLSEADRLAHDLATFVRSAEHERTKDPLPTRPRGGHPQAVR
ncbi:hypothetical protein [Streptomyces griseofuscus]|uniref:hypothetical protein n=1 Tax=Streptomyces griseofuscus TaxID=146922 RepID=UPI00155A880B|nr:hypothetical protein [Streptomyces griseofuscus]